MAVPGRRGRLPLPWLAAGVLPVRNPRRPRRPPLWPWRSAGSAPIVRVGCQLLLLRQAPILPRAGSACRFVVGLLAMQLIAGQREEAAELLPPGVAMAVHGNPAADENFFVPGGRAAELVQGI